VEERAWAAEPWRNNESNPDRQRFWNRGTWRPPFDSDRFVDLHENEGVLMSSTRRIAVVTGALFIVAAAAAIVGLVLEGPVLNDPGYIVGGPGNDTRVILGAFFEVILAIAVVGTSVTLFPIVKKQNESIALSYVCGRVVEAIVIVVGMISLLAVVTLRREFAGTTDANSAALLVVGKSLVAIHDWTFLFGPSLAIGVNTLLLAYLMYSSRLVPRVIAVLGLIGGPLIFASGTAEMFGLYQQISVWGSIGALPVFAWEMSLAVWLIVKGFKPSPIISGNTGHVGVDDRFPARAAAAE
jgi:hypothetical protein